MYNDFYDGIKIGEKYGKLVPLWETGTKQMGCKLYRCKCDCGNMCSLIGNSIWKGRRLACKRCQPKNFESYKQRNAFCKKNFQGEELKKVLKSLFI